MKKSVIALFLLFQMTIMAQFISVKSLPVSTGDQFLIYPSQNISMAGLNIGFEDKWLDAFNNPANGSDIHNLNLFVLPTFYNTSDNLGGASTLPLTLFLKNNDWFGVISFALQQHEGASINNNFWGQELVNIHSNRNNSNKYGLISIGKKLSSSNWMVGASFFSAGLGAVDGVDLLYNQSTKIEQDGNIYEFRTGLFYKDDTSIFETIVLYNTYKMEHNVEYISAPWMSMQRVAEINKDKTNTWGIHLGYKEKPKENKLQIGAIATLNYKSHPKIPNYSIMNIPRDPGDSWCYNFGVGLGSENETTRFGIDLIYEPIWSNTWAEAAELIELENDRKIYPGQKTIENDFSFDNIIGRIGYLTKINNVDLSAGLEIYHRSYSLVQRDFISINKRSQEEKWAEYTWSWGAELHFKYFDIKYNGHIITGAGIPGVFRSTFENFSGAKFLSDFVVAPSGSLNLDYKTTSMHQFIIHVPIPNNWTNK
jgi:hypothetical protein